MLFFFVCDFDCTMTQRAIVRDWYNDYVFKFELSVRLSESTESIRLIPCTYDPKNANSAFIKDHLNAIYGQKEYQLRFEVQSNEKIISLWFDKDFYQYRHYIVYISRRKEGSPGMYLVFFFVQGWKKLFDTPIFIIIMYLNCCCNLFCCLFLGYFFVFPLFFLCFLFVCGAILIE